MDPKKTRGTFWEWWGSSFLPCLEEDEDNDDLREGGSEKVTERDREREGLLYGCSEMRGEGGGGGVW